MTDGLENASTRWTYAQLQRLIEQEKEGHGWEFLFLGANMDAVKEASRLGIALNGRLPSSTTARASRSISAVSAKR